MFKPNLLSKTAPTVLSALAILCLAGSQAFAGTLQGSIQKEGYIRTDENTMLNRSEIAPGGDAFKRTQPDSFTQEAFDPGNMSNIPMMMAPPPPPPPKISLVGNVGQDGNLDFGGQSQNAMPDRSRAPFGLGAETSGQQGQQFTPNDPDSTPEMQLAWDAWHKRVAEAIYVRYTTLANVAFHTSPPLMAQAAYTVTRDGRIVSARLLQRNNNPIYNAIILTAINSLNGNIGVLQYPQGSHRTAVEKSGTFTQNYGDEGFMYTTGDRETVRGTPQFRGR